MLCIYRVKKTVYLEQFNNLTVGRYFEISKRTVWRPCYSNAHPLMRVLDFISGMTDNYAMYLSCQKDGISGTI